MLVKKIKGMAKKIFRACRRMALPPEKRVRLKRKLKRKSPLLYSGYYFFSRERGEDIVDSTNRVDAEYGRLARTGLFTLDMPLIVINPYRLAPLTAMVLFATKEECRAEAVTAGFGGGQDFESHTEPTRFHRIPVLGLYPGRENKVTLVLKSEDGAIVENREYRIPMGEIPQELVHVADVKKKKSGSAFPFKLVVGGDTPYPYAVDETGTVRYYIRKKSRSYGLFPLSGGRMWFMEKTNHMVCRPSFSNPVGTRVYELDWWGRVMNVFQLRCGIHHDVCEKEPGGNIIAASASLEKYTEDAVIEIDRHTGKTVKMVKFENLLPGLSYCDGIDWVHINSVQYVPEQDSVLVCARNLHSVFLIDWESGKLKWIMGPESFWRGTGFENYLVRIPAGENFYQPHAAGFLGEDRVMVYDNHTNKRHPVADFDEDKKSYVKVFRLDAENRRARLLRSFSSEKSTIRSNGVFCGEKNRMFVMSGYLSRKIERNQGLIYEYDAESGRLLNRMETVYSFYRAYEFAPDTVMMGKALPERSSWLCEFDRVERVDRGEVVHAQRLPGCFARIVRAWAEPEKEKVRMRKGERARTWKERDTAELMPYIRIRRERRCLLVSGHDHLVQAIYLAGADGVFKADYSDTRQEMPQHFARFYYGVPFDLQQIQAGPYRVYLRCDSRVYDTGYRVTV